MSLNTSHIHRHRLPSNGIGKWIRWFFTLLLLPLAGICLAGPVEHDNLQIVQRYLVAWNNADRHAFSEVLDERVEYFNSSTGAPHQGREAVTEVSEMLQQRLPGRKMTLRAPPIVSSDGVAIEWEFTATLPPDAASTPDRRRNVRLEGVSLFRVRNGKIVYASDYYNGLSMREQLAP